MHLQPADDDVHAVGEPETVAADLEELAFGDERLQQTAEGRTILARDTEELEEFTRGGRMAHAIADLTKKFFSREHSIENQFTFICTPGLRPRQSWRGRRLVEQRDGG
jgi:hypothetical protein